MSSVLGSSQLGQKRDVKYKRSASASCQASVLAFRCWWHLCASDGLFLRDKQEAATSAESSEATGQLSVTSQPCLWRAPSTKRPVAFVPAVEIRNVKKAKQKPEDDRLGQTTFIDQIS